MVVETDAFDRGFNREAFIWTKFKIGRKFDQGIVRESREVMAVVSVRKGNGNRQSIVEQWIWELKKELIQGGISRRRIVVVEKVVIGRRGRYRRYIGALGLLDDWGRHWTVDRGS